MDAILGWLLTLSPATLYTVIAATAALENIFPPFPSDVVVAFGSFVAAIPAPLGIGTVTLENGEQVKGFLCEARATQGARDITGLGGWRQFIQGGGHEQPRSSGT